MFLLDMQIKHKMNFTNCFSELIATAKKQKQRRNARSNLESYSQLLCCAVKKNLQKIDKIKTLTQKQHDTKFDTTICCFSKVKITSHAVQLQVYSVWFLHTSKDLQCKRSCMHTDLHNALSERKSWCLFWKKYPQPASEKQSVYFSFIPK